MPFALPYTRKPWLGLLAVILLGGALAAAACGGDVTIEPSDTDLDARIDAALAERSAGPAADAGLSQGYDSREPTQTVTATLLAPPLVPDPIERRAPARVIVDLESTEQVGRLADGTEYEFWTFNGTVPGPLIRVRAGDVVQINLTNRGDSAASHNIDLHAVNGPGGGAAVTTVAPGETKSFEFKALAPGAYVYHCAVAPVAHHIANGMYGMIVVEPEEGLPPVDHEFYVMQQEVYTAGERGQTGLRDFDLDAMLDERPEWVIFNGQADALIGDGALQANVGDSVRIFFGVGGPNLISSFHVIGEIFDTVYQEASFSAVAHNVQTTTVAPGGATVVEFTLNTAGTYLLVDHAIGRAIKGAAGQLVATGPDNTDVFRPLGSTAASPAPQEDTADETAAAVEPGREIDLVMRDFEFDANEIRVTAGERVTLVIANEGTVAHDMSSDEFVGAVLAVNGEASQDGAFHAPANPGDSVTITFVADEPGEYEVFCSVPGHRELGMVGTLIVEGA